MNFPPKFFRMLSLFILCNLAVILMENTKKNIKLEEPTVNQTIICSKALTNEFNTQIVEAIVKQTKAGMSEHNANTTSTFISIAIGLAGFFFLALYYLFTYESQRLETIADRKFEEFTNRTVNQLNTKFQEFTDRTVEQLNAILQAQRLPNFPPSGQPSQPPTSGQPPPPSAPLIQTSQANTPSTSQQIGLGQQQIQPTAPLIFTHPPPTNMQQSPHILSQQQMGQQTSSQLISPPSVTLIQQASTSATVLQPTMVLNPLLIPGTQLQQPIHLPGQQLGIQTMSRSISSPLLATVQPPPQTLPIAANLEQPQETMQRRTPPPARRCLIM